MKNQDKAFVLLVVNTDDPVGEFDAPSIVGVYQSAEDARLAAEMRNGHGLAWARWPWGLQSAEYRVVEVPYHDREAFRRQWGAETLRQLMEAREDA